MKFNMINSLILAGALTMAVNAQTVNQREENQQDRIAQGVKSGQLTPGETARLEGREAKVNRQTNRERAANGGTLKPAQKAHAQRELNRDSAAIYKDKHTAAQQQRCSSRSVVKKI